MSIPVLVLFVMFFVLVGPLFLYWFIRQSKQLMSKRPSFIYFPRDGEGNRGQSSEANQQRE